MYPQLFLKILDQSTVDSKRLQRPRDVRDSLSLRACQAGWQPQAEYKSAAAAAVQTLPVPVNLKGQWSRNT
eukprot:1699557-Rhodomonas_salina.1